MLNKTATSQYVKLEFPSYGEAVDFAERVSAPDLGKGEERASRSEGRAHSWDMGLGFEGSIEMARRGFVKLAPSIAATSAHIAGLITSRIEREEFFYDVSGDCLDVARYLQGEPEHFLTPEPIFKDGAGQKIIKLGVNISADHTIDAEAIQRRGAIICATIELLGLSGYSVELYAIMSQEYSSVVDTIIKIKEPDQALDMGKIAFAFAHPAFMRRICFAIWESALTQDERNAVGIPYNGYGCPRECKAEFDLTFSQITNNAFARMTDEEAQKFIIERLKAVGVHLKEYAK